MFESFFRVFRGATGLTPHIQYRTDYGFPESPVESFADVADEDRLDVYASCQHNLVVERYEEFCIAHVEFDDQGQFWDRRQLKALEDELVPMIEQEASFPGALIICFMHGWQNNARHDNGNLRSFRSVLFNMYQTELKMSRSITQQPPRRIFGIFLSWRGQSNRWPLIKQLTFWNRKKTAHKVGQGDLIEAVSRIEQLRFHEPLAKRHARLIVIGHSFGGAAVYSAVSPYIKTVATGEDEAADVERDRLVGRVQQHTPLEKFAENEREAAVRIKAILDNVPAQQQQVEFEKAFPVAKIRGFGDLVILVNPAFEALLYDGLNELTKDIVAYSADQNVVLMTVGADNDWATGAAFPLGQLLARWYQKRQPKQWPKIITTCANLDEFITHELSAASTNAGQPKKEVGGGRDDGSMYQWTEPADYQSVDGTYDWENFVPEQKNWDLTEVRQPPMPKNYALMTIRARDKLVDGHSGIFGTVFMEFVRDFVIAQDLYAAWPHSPPADLEQPPAAEPEQAVEEFRKVQGRLTGAQKKHIY